MWVVYALVVCAISILWLLSQHTAVPSPFDLGFSELFLSSWCISVSVVVSGLVGSLHVIFWLALDCVAWWIIGITFVTQTAGFITVFTVGIPACVPDYRETIFFSRSGGNLRFFSFSLCELSHTSSMVPMVFTWKLLVLWSFSYWSLWIHGFSYWKSCRKVIPANADYGLDETVS